MAARVGYGDSDSQPHSAAKQPRLHAFHGVYVIFAFLFNVQVRGACCETVMVMMKSALIDELAKLFDVEHDEAATLFNGFCGALVAELLAFRKLSIKGLGAFYVTHVPATKQNSGSSIIFAPPVNKLRFESALSSGDETVPVVMSRLAMSQQEAARFARSLATLFAAAMQQEQEIHLNGLGRFALEDGAYSFFPERTLEELLNREYQDLKEVVLPNKERTVEPKREWKMPRAVLPIAAAMAVLALLTVLYNSFSDRLFSAATTMLSQPAERETVAEIGQQHTPPPSQKSPKSSAIAAADSLVLLKGEYAIVLATFESEAKAFRELAPLRNSGMSVFIWPAFMQGEKYFRITTGRFATREAANEQLKLIPAKMANGAYIQQVKKTVVVYGKKGL